MSESPIVYTVRPQELTMPSDEDLAKGAQVPQPLCYPGVPLRDLTQADIDAMPAWLQHTLEEDISGLYDHAEIVPEKKLSAVSR